MVGSGTGTDTNDLGLVYRFDDGTGKEVVHGTEI
jgi:hypothetical protein